MTCTCPKPSLHDRVLRAISIRNGEECSDLVIAAARLLVDTHDEAEVAALRSAIETARSMGRENLAEDLEKLLAQMEDDSADFAT